MKDILPEERYFWNHVFKKSTPVIEDYGFREIVLPVVEKTDLFIRSVGKNTDIVEKEMYSFKTRGGDMLSLRPEFTAGTLRAYIENGMHVKPHPVRLWSSGPLFRHDNPQYGRQRQFHQLNVESIGDEDAVVDAEMIFMAYRVLQAIGLKGMIVKINSIGDDSCRPQYIKTLKDFYRNKTKKICVKCRNRLKSNPLRVLDCMEDTCKEVAKEAPTIVDSLDSTCKKHFTSVLEFLDETGVPYLLDPHLVRGLDYYTRTVFEFVPEGAGEAEEVGEVVIKDDSSEIKDDLKTEENIDENENKDGQEDNNNNDDNKNKKNNKPSVPNLAVISGGRYDKLIEYLGGPKTPAIGWAMGIERVVLLMKAMGVNVSKPRSNAKVFLAQLSEAGRRKGLILFDELRKSSIAVKSSFGRDSIKSQLRIAAKMEIPYTLIVGQKEALEGTVILREMNTGIQETIPTEKIIRVLKKKIKK